MLFFAGRRKLWSPRRYNGPVAVAEVRATRRRLPALTQRGVLELAVVEFDLRKLGILTAEELAARIRQQAGWAELPGKLKFDLQRPFDQHPCSRPALADSLVRADQARHPITCTESA